MNFQKKTFYFRQRINENLKVKQKKFVVNDFVIKNNVTSSL